jgi:hypothetical protein
MSNIDRLREHLNDPIIESECGSLENFIENVIAWAGSLERIAIATREDQKDAASEALAPLRRPARYDPTDRMYENEIIE